MSGEHQDTAAQMHNVLAQHLPAADGFDPLHQKAGQVKGRVVDDGVHRHPDDLGRHVVGHHGDYHHEEGQKELSRETLGKGEKPQDAGFFLCVLVHNTPQVGKKDGGPYQEAWHLPGQAGPCGGAGAAKKGRQALGKACRPFHGSKTLLETAQQGKPERAPALCLFGRAALGGSPAVGRLSRRPPERMTVTHTLPRSHRKSQQHSSPREENVVRKFSRLRGIPPCILRDIGL